MKYAFRLIIVVLLLTGCSVQTNFNYEKEQKLKESVLGMEEVEDTSEDFGDLVSDYASTSKNWLSHEEAVKSGILFSDDYVYISSYCDNIQTSSFRFSWFGSKIAKDVVIQLEFDGNRMKTVKIPYVLGDYDTVCSVSILNYKKVRVKSINATPVPDADYTIHTFHNNIIRTKKVTIERIGLTTLKYDGMANFLVADKFGTILDSILRRQKLIFRLTENVIKAVMM